MEQPRVEQTLVNQRVAWCFTINNPTITKEQFVDEISERCKYLIVANEVGESGTPHFQGYLELKKKLRFAQVKTLFLPLVPHLEGRRGTSQEASDYCKKDGDFLEYGQMSVTRQGKRSDLDDQADMLIEGKDMRDVALASPATYVRNYRGLKALQDLIAPKPRVFKPEFQLHLYYGRTGTGKTYKAFMDNPDIFRKPVGDGLWFDGLEIHHKVVLIDECVGQYKLADLLQVTDVYACKVQTKGGHAHLDADLMIFTTNIHPATWYKGPNGIPYEGREENGRALMRRFTKILYFVTRDDVREIPDKTHFWENYSEYQ
uniref:Replication-associated protein n=1 Tax=Phoenicopteridae CRESS-DNA-virus sp. TaxID=2815051 RepID=A0A8A4XCM7_9VIRU|nr:MAG: replication-associated protein [Phoenicopteridae CRESS-DNA-virus sp.]